MVDACHQGCMELLEHIAGLTRVLTELAGVSRIRCRLTDRKIREGRNRT